MKLEYIINIIAELFSIFLKWRTENKKPSPDSTPENQPKPQKPDENQETSKDIPVNDSPIASPPIAPAYETVCNEHEYVELVNPYGKLESMSLSFALRGIDSKKFPTIDGWLMGVMGTTKAGNEYNIQFHIFKDGNNSQVRLISQCFDPNPNGGKPFHESIDSVSNIEFDPAKIYNVIVYGPVSHLTKGFPVWRMDIDCNGTTIGCWEINFFGAFESIKWIRIGNEIFSGRPGQHASITVINPKLTR